MQQRNLVGLIGTNIQKSLSPALFEHACASVGMHGYYHLMDLDHLSGRTLESLLQAAVAAGFRGVNVTYPCKEAVLPLLDAISPEARQIGAVNTVVISPDGKTEGFNTDRSGFRKSFEEQLGASSMLGKTATLVGAGGAGRAVAFALLDLGAATLFVHDQRPEASASLVEALVRYAGPGRAKMTSDIEAALSTSAGIVNATPVGMLGIPGIPFPTDSITPDQWVADVIYTPLETECLKLSRARSAKVMGGSGMCVHQAAETFSLFTGASTDVQRLHAAFGAAAAEREKLLSVAVTPSGGIA